MSNGFLARRGRIGAEAWKAVSVQEFALFAGPNADRLIPAFEKARAKALGRTGWSWSFCWPALFFTFAWFMYRKMYLTGFVLLVLPPMIFLAFPALGSAGPGYIAAIAAIGKPIYAAHAMAKIQKLRSNGRETDDAIRQAGGVSMVAGTIGGVIWLALAAVSLLALFAPEQHGSEVIN